MNCMEFKGFLADLVGGELDEGARGELLAHAELCAGCRRELNGFQAAAAAIEADVPSAADADAATAGLALRREQAKRSAAGDARVVRLVLVAARYAAVIVLAFGAGYAVRNRAAPATAGEAMPAVAKAPPTESWGRQLQRASIDFPAAPSFSHGLLMLARP